MARHNRRMRAIPNLQFFSGLYQYFGGWDAREDTQVRDAYTCQFLLLVTETTNN